MNGNTLCVVTPIILLVLWVALSVPRAGHDRRYDIERRQDGTLTTTTQDETPMQIRARAARIEDAVRQRKSRQVMLEAPYRGLFDKPPIETVDGEVMPDDAPQLGSGAPQLPSGESRAIAKSKWRGW